MKTRYILYLILITQMVFAQKSIPLPLSPYETTQWEGPEKNYFSEVWQTEVITNVSIPTLEVFLAPDSLNTGTSVIIAPGGGLYALSIESEGNMVARWLNKKGINAFVLKYRLVPSGEDGVADLNRDSATDDPLNLAAPAVDLYTAWQEKKRPVALQMYSKGGHGFGMRKQGLPSDGWIQRFYEWIVAEGLVKK